MDDGDFPEHVHARQDGKTKDLANEVVNGTAAMVQNDSNPFHYHQSGWLIGTKECWARFWGL